MAKPFFQNYNLTQYRLTDSNFINYDQTIVNITTHFKMIDVFKQNAFVYYPYIIKDHDTSDTIAYHYYGDSNYFWLVLLCNDILNPYEKWPLTETQFLEFIENKYKDLSEYSGLDYSLNNYKYYTEDNYETDVNSWGSYYSTTGTTKTLFDYEYELNESKRNIQLVGNQFLPIINKQLEKILYV